MPTNLLLVALLALVACRSPGTSEPPPAAAVEQRPVIAVFGADGARHPVRVELVTTPEQRAQGLMHRREMAADDGMLFVFPETSVQSFWMKNTYLPLDMLFIDEDWTVVGIVEHAEPLTLSPRTVGKPSKYVLEVNAGWSRRNGVAAGVRADLSAGDTAAKARGVR